MSAEDQHQHAQLLVSLASEHFIQQASGSQDSGSQSDNPQSADEQTTSDGDMTVQPVVRLSHEEAEAAEGGDSAPAMPFNLRKKRKQQHERGEENPRQEEYRLFGATKFRQARPQDMRRPVRPIDRQKMRPWLKNLLDSGQVFGLNWSQRDEGIFQISWRHASRLGWNLETDGDVFERWARHTGIFKDGDEPEPKRWKANFRCALHSLPDVKELTSPTDRKGRNASRTYRFLRPNEVVPPVKRKQRYSIQISNSYSGYEPQQSDDSGSAKAESDDRNTDEEVSVVVEQMPRAFPHCDHDYAIRTDATEEEQTTSAVLAKHNSGYVLIKSKDAHEYEFRLTGPDSDSSQPTSAKRATPPKSSSPQRKGKESKKKGTPSKKGKGKPVPKGKLLKKGKKGANNKEASPATKVSLKALLSGRKGSKKGKGPQKPGQAPTTKKGKEGKKGGAAKGKGKKDSDSGPGTPTQSQGLQALLEAANQIDRLDALTSASVTTPPNTKTITSPMRTTRRSSAAATSVSSAASRPVPTALVKNLAVSTATPASTSAGSAPVIITTQPVMTAQGTSLPVGTTLLGPLPAGPNAATPQISMAVLQKLLSLSSLPAGTVATVSMGGVNSIPVQVMPAAPMPKAKLTAAVKAPTVSQSTRVTRRKLAELASDKPAHVSAAAAATATHATVSSVTATAAPVPSVTATTSANPPVPLLMTQPEAGTSMLKHLLRLTAPGLATTTATGLSSGHNPHLIPAAPKVLPPFISTMTTNASRLRQSTVETPTVLTSSAHAAASQPVKVESSADQDSYQMLGEYELESSQQVAWNESVPKNFPYIRVSTSKVYVKSENDEAASIPDPVVTISRSTVSAQEPVVSVGEQASVSFSQAVDALLQGSASQTVTVTQSGDSSQPTSEQTVTVTLPGVSLPGASGQGTSTATMDLMQFINLFAGNSSGQVLIKSETPAQSDVDVMSSTYSLSSSTDNTAQVTVSVTEMESTKPGLSTADITDHVLAESVDMPSSSAEDNMPDLMMEVEEGQDGAVVSSSSVEVVQNQFIMNEADISSLVADHQGTESFVVDSIL